MVIKYAQNGKRDLHQTESMFDDKIEKIRNEEWKFDSNRRIILEYILACKRGRVKSGKTNKRVSKSWLYRIMGILKQLSEDWLQKPFDECDFTDWNIFYDNMEDDIIKSCNGKAYHQNTKCKIYKIIKKFAKWKWSDGLTYPDFCNDWVTTEIIQSKNHISFNEARDMIETAHATKVKCLIAMAFDGGFRIQEMANFKWSDLTFTDSGFYRVKVRAETCKTGKERSVDLFLEQTTQLVSQFKNLIFKGNEDDFLFPTSYRNLYKTCIKISLKAIGKRVNPHMLRHSSATYYSDIIKTYQQFCYRYGWDLSSDTAQRYFHGSNSDLIYQDVVKHETSKIKSHYETVKAEKHQLDRQVDFQEKDISQMKKEIRELRDMLILVISQLSSTQNIPDGVLVKCGEHIENGRTIIEVD